MTKTLNHIIFFSSIKIRIFFFSNIGNLNIFLEKHHNFQTLEFVVSPLHHVAFKGDMVLNATFNNISIISWRSVSLVEEEPPNFSKSQTQSQNVVQSTPRLSRIRTHNISGDSHRTTIRSRPRRSITEEKMKNYILIKIFFSGRCCFL